MLQITPEIARRLAISSQQLDGRNVPVDEVGVLSLLQHLGCLQLDPINVVARSPLLVLWSRLGKYDPADLNTLLWEDRVLFEYWAHAASIVLTDDFPLHQPRMDSFAKGNRRWEKRVREWMAANESLRRSILRQLAERGPLFVDELETPPDVVPWQTGGWHDSRNLTVMLSLLWERGEIMVTRRTGNGLGLRKQWGLFEHHLPQWADHTPWSDKRVVSAAAQKSLRALGLGTTAHIKNHFVRGRYPGLTQVLAELERDGLIEPIQIKDGEHRWPQKWYVHRDTVPLLERLSSGEWFPRTTLLSPFDNLICDRTRTETLFAFEYRSEIYTPKRKRKYGYYVMPILYGDRLVGRIDPKLDRTTRHLTINAVHLEPTVKETSTLKSAISQTIEALALFLEAEQVHYR